LCVAYAFAGRVDLDLAGDPLGAGADGQPVYLRDIWPSPEEVHEAITLAVTREQFESEYDVVFEGDERWTALPSPEGATYAWSDTSTYVQQPPYFLDMPPRSRAVEDIVDAQVLVMVGDSVTTDHISPAGTIKADSPAGAYLQERGVAPRDFNSYGARRGNHQVMLRGTFANVRLRNALAPGTEGPWTTFGPTGEQMWIYDAAERYRATSTPLMVIAGKEYGSGSSRDWAAKGPALLGVRVVIAESYERIHRSNLVGMGIVPLQFAAGDTPESLGLDGTESFTIRALDEHLLPGEVVTVQVRRIDGNEFTFSARMRVDSTTEVAMMKHGGVLPMVLREMLHTS